MRHDIAGEGGKDYVELRTPVETIVRGSRYS